MSNDTPQIPRVYGHQGTIHQTTQLDVETDKHGNVVAVWFRCQLLPFQQVTVDDQRAKEMTRDGGEHLPSLVAVELQD